MRTLSAIVFLRRQDEWIPAGRLQMVEDGRSSHSVFDYGARYLQRPDRLALDPVMLPLPLPAAPAPTYRTEPGFALFNGLRDAAPDGWGRYLMDKAAGAAPLDEFDYLMASGDDRIGALAFGDDPREGPRRRAPWGADAAPGERVDLAVLAEAAARAYDVDRLDPGLRRLLEAGSSLGGARPKAMTEIDGEAWIAKFPAKDDTFPIGRVEYATMSLATACGLEAPPIRLIEVYGRDVYLIQRFDRGAAPDRTPFVSGLTLLGAHESEVTRYSYAELATQLRLFGSKPEADLRELFRRMVFNILVLNDDDHLRNHGFLHDGQGWRLSPLYDVVPKPQRSLDRRLVLGVGPEGRVATLENAAAGAGGFGLKADEAAALIGDLRDQVRATWRAHFQAAGLPESTIERFATCFRQAFTDDERVKFDAAVADAAFAGDT